MTTIDAINSSIATELTQLNALISTKLESQNALMTQVVKGFLRKKGKQIRPILVILTAKLFGKVNENTISAAASVEMLHNASLIHDDVVDESKLRRGVPTINSVWDNHIAVLVGDFFVSTSLGIAADTADWRMVSALARLGRMLSTGELDQIYHARNHLLDEESYYKVIYNKTASLFVTCVEMGAATADATPGQVEAIRRVARLLGLCFQIRDDIFDYFSDPAVGKPTGNDLREGKVTLPLLYALKNSALPERQQMSEVIGHEELTSEEISLLIDFALRSGGIEYAYESMERMSAEAESILDSLEGVDNEARESFRTILRYIISRKA
ncbi:MAG: polyprenyl synthetase family protein [Clostridium sp.]|nr:polyprenyl synthetase family protein [Clostridium sp.]